MTEQERFDRELSGWMRDHAPRRAPEHLVPMVMTTLRGYPQRGASRFSSLGAWVPLAGGGILTAVVVALVALGPPIGPPTAASTPPVVSGSASASESASDATVTPLDLPSFTVGSDVRAADANATWTALTWRQLAVDDPLASIRTIVRWSRGFVAFGAYRPDLEGSPTWTSTDGVHYRPTGVLDGAIVLDVVEINEKLAAFVSLNDSVDCPPFGACYADLDPLQLLLSADGITWQPGPTPHLAANGPVTAGLLLADGPSGVLVATSAGPPVAALTTDGQVWSPVSNGFPPRFELAGLWGRPDGYAAVGTVVSGASDSSESTATTLWSTNGRDWTVTSGTLASQTDFALTASEHGPMTSFTWLMPARDGAVALRHEGGIPGLSSLWISTDGRSWEKVREFEPLGPALRGDGSSFGVPDGQFASDGSRMFAIRVDNEPGAWTSFAGTSWSRLALNGPIPPGGELLVLPNGVLLFDGQAMWSGTAMTGPQQ